MQVYENEHEDMMMTVMNLGNIYFAMKQYDKALEFYMRALKGQQETLGKQHTSSLTSMMNIANVLNDGMRDFAQAEVYYKSALDEFEVSEEATARVKRGCAGVGVGGLNE
ncbi:hypothetical protein TL16_g09303 [Triparma laevis f. inornata]|uniref:Kinesin light chain n=1 Tax=Triparma laevis f. inornata TaxID=1714386 RepID=A0A9W7BA20_9STRA|nr:hypothetical protein TL16_g09303 [Triparma laevis f. inornata]